MGNVPITSLEAYEDCIESGYINRIQFEVIKYFAEFDHEEGLTTKEIMDKIGRIKRNNTWVGLQDYQKCIRPLYDMGVLIRMEPRLCKISTTNKRAFPHRLSWKHPEKIKKKITKSDKVKEILNLLSDLKEVQGTLFFDSCINEITEKLKEI